MPLSHPNGSKPSNGVAPQILSLALGRGRTAMTTAMPAGTTRTHTRAEGSWHHRSAGPAGAHAGWKRSWEDDHPLGTFGTIHAAVMPEWVIVPGDESTGEEDHRDHENCAGDDHYPGRDLVEPRMLRCVGRRRRRRPGMWRLDLGLGCLRHPSIMPTRAPAIKHRAEDVAEPLSA
jgi:hypothetical protein